MNIKNIIRNKIPKRFIDFLIRTEYSRFQNLPSYSLHCEDLFLYSFFKNKKNGFFIDIGAHHPFKYSNTFLFYKENWTGINLDPLPGSMDLFNLFRKKDINLQIGVSDKNEKLEYYMFKEPAFNTFNKEVAENYIQKQEILIDKIEIETMTLKKILDLYSNNKEIDFMSIDVEGFELSVLNSNDWSKYRPYLLLVEDNDININTINEKPVVQFMSRNKYKINSIFLNNILFQRNDI